ncbi:cysteine desulfurase family protein [Halalkalibacillus halophilus]|uniref:cysteine desulfurase family protein n=1 Tax=Halalkalibacillus halophilus TaxID=392827 RepID=UPI0003FF1C20|nr:cysteine desulfurase family protein [Halalkalibacillus halophilus]
MDYIYLDHAATTPLHQSVQSEMKEMISKAFGNPSSIHHFGRETRKVLDRARENVATSINAKFNEIIFTSGGTEANNLAIFGAVEANKDKGNHVITSEIEHHAVLHPFEELERKGYEVTYLPVDTSGTISMADFQKELRDDTIFVSVMTVNNETGIRQPVEKIADQLKDHQAIFHTDAVQAYGVESIDVNELPVDLLTVSSHKIYGPKGIGFLYKNHSIHVKQQLFGGEQERKWRSGTENVLAIVGFDQAIRSLKEELNSRKKHYEKLSNEFIKQLQASDVICSINGETSLRSPHIVNVSFEQTDVEQLLMNLDLEGIAVSSGSACTAGSINPSHVLTAMYGEEDARLRNSVRFSFGKDNNLDDIKRVVNTLEKITSRLRRLA